MTTRLLFFLMLLGVLIPALAGAPTLAGTLSLPPDAGAPPGNSTVFPLAIDDATGIVATDIVITYDPLVALALDVSKTPLTNGQLLTVNLNVPGEIVISLFSGVPLSGGGDFLSLTFESVGPEDSQTALVLASVQLNEGLVPAILEDGHYCAQARTGEIQNFLVEAVAPGSAVATLSWDADPFADGYNLYRGLQADLTDAACFVAGLAGTQTTDDGLTPGSGAVLFYLVTSNNCRGEATPGFAGTGEERDLPAPCP